MSALFGNVEILLITDPNWLILAPLMEVYYANQDSQIGADISAAAIITAFGSLYIQSRYNTLANNYYNLYKTQRDFYYNNFQTGGEAPLLTQVFTNPLAGNGQSGTSYTPQYLAQAANVAGFDTQGAFSSDWWQFHTNMYNDAPFSYANNPRGYAVSGIGEPEALDKAAIIDDYDTYLYRYEEHRKDVYDERTWEWQNQALNFGVKQASVVESGLAMSFKFLDEADGNLADWFSTQSNGLARQSGYRQSLQSASQQLAASTQLGKALSISPNLGVDRYGAFPRDVQQNLSKRIERGMDYGAT
jgi:hypothetical protein